MFVYCQAQSPVPSMNEIDKSRAVVCPAGVNDDQFSQSELDIVELYCLNSYSVPTGELYGILQEASLGLEGLDMFVSPRMRSESVGIDPRLIANLPAIPSSISNAIGDDKLKVYVASLCLCIHLNIIAARSFSTCCKETSFNQRPWQPSTDIQAVLLWLRSCYMDGISLLWI